jgi:hypothetical protein
MRLGPWILATAGREACRRLPRGLARASSAQALRLALD